MGHRGYPKDEGLYPLVGAVLLILGFQVWAIFSQVSKRLAIHIQVLSATVFARAPPCGDHVNISKHQPVRKYLLLFVLFLLLS